MSHFVFSCEPGWEGLLIGELRRTFSECDFARSAAGWVTGEVSDESAGSSVCVALCAQCLPRAEVLRPTSISEWVRVAGERIIAGLADHTGAWRLHVFGVYRGEGSVRPGRCRLVRDGIFSLLQKKQRRLLRTLSADDGPWQANEAIAQIALTTPGNGYISLCDESQRHRFRRMIAPFSGGIAEIPADREAPSRAFAKLLEAEIRIRRQIDKGETCVDLGSSPGSWAYVALRRGARVVAIDRSPLREDLMQDRNLTFLRGDAFAYRPAETVDWLLCDVIARPERTIELLQTWIQRRWCRRFCVTIKFQGTEDYPLLEPLKAWLATAGAEFILRRLTNNKNEITAAGEIAAGETAAGEVAAGEISPTSPAIGQNSIAAQFLQVFFVVSRCAMAVGESFRGYLVRKCV